MLKVIVVARASAWSASLRTGESLDCCGVRLQRAASAL